MQKVNGSFLGTWQRLLGGAPAEWSQKQRKKAFLKRKVQCSVAFLKVSPMPPQPPPPPLPATSMQPV